MTSDPYDYWIKRETDLPNLALVAYQVSTSPASKAPIEGIFSTGGEAIRGKRSC